MSARKNRRAVEREEAPANPCSQDCPNRHPGCHGDCDPYMEFWLHNRKQEAARKRRFEADELLIRSVEKGLAIKRAMKGKLH